MDTPGCIYWVTSGNDGRLRLEVYHCPEAMVPNPCASLEVANKLWNKLRNKGFLSEQEFVAVFGYNPQEA